ncbi:MAG TPA: DUF5916 domain-containing protein [Verrucomicrobiae bacterium]|nr:DUF5916 domain-containing protein [Verrucomicrobiae bacterium]
MKRWIAALLVLAATPAPAAIVLDGKLDESEWQQAQRLTGFKTTDPLTLAEPAHATTVLVHSDADGMYFGFICDQPPGVERIRTRGQRDQFIAGDRVNLMLDFDGTGQTGYEFTAYLGGEKQDAIISRQTQYNYDWDVDWDYAASETDQQWFIEYRIPWTVAPQGQARDGMQTIGVFLSRVVVKTGQRYSFPPHAFARSTFVADMQKVQIAAHGRAQLDFIPYAGGSYDFLDKETDGRAGFDLFWKPSGQHQLTATVNPDFGQVESDQLVVNFSAIPTQFPDKRPFFTENLGLFSTETIVLYTRRIGAAPDAGPEGASDILGALKYTGASGNLAYGLITAWEDDGSVAQGRDFYVGRARYRFSDSLTAGWIGTHVERPTLTREADVNSLDLLYTFAPGISLVAQGTLTEVTHPAPTILDPAGSGKSGRFVFRYAPGGRIDNETYLILKDRLYNINDAGFMSRPSEHALQNLSTVYWRDFAATDALQQVSWWTNVLGRTNDEGDRLPATIVTYIEAQRRDQHLFGVEYDDLTMGGIDDLITRGNGPVKLPDRDWLFPYWVTPKGDALRHVLVAGFGEGYFDDAGYWHLKWEPTLDLMEGLSLTGSFRHSWFADELIWQGVGNLLGAFEYEQEEASVDVNWFPVARHELRLKFQWVAGSGDAVAAYRPDASGTLGRTADPIDDFSFTTTAFQVRYRYELAPLSELFVVYSHGGDDFDLDRERSLGSSFRRGLAEETASQFLVKLRYRFALL